jgi:NhaP-type Na+/H+ or K+/H+ antiporter
MLGRKRAPQRWRSSWRTGGNLGGSVSFVADDPNIQNIISLLTPFAIYLLAEEPSQRAWKQLGISGEFAFSGVLAMVTAGSTWVDAARR